MPSTNYGAALEYLQSRIPGFYDPRETAFTYGATAVRMLPANPERVLLVMCNLGGVSCWVAPSERCADDYGIRLAGNGGILGFSAINDFIMPALEWHVVGDGAAGTIFLLEAIRIVRPPMGE